MRTKKAAAATRTTSAMRFQAKAAANGDVVIEGWANKAVVDRGKDLIPKSAWNLQNYAKGPIILFNHDRDLPIGKAVAVEARDEGLYVKCVISKSDNPKIAMVRDLVKEGILNGFSVGFDAQDEQRDNDGVNTIKAAELYEISVVTLPQNQDSLFTLTTKSLPSSLGEARLVALRAKGAKLAEALQTRLNELEKDPNYKRDDALAKAATAAGGTVDDARSIISGEMAAVPDAWVKAFASALGMDGGKLAAAAKEDAATDGPKEPAAKTKPEDPPPSAPASAAPAEGGGGSGAAPAAPEGDTKPEKKSAGGVAVYAVLVPKDQAETPEDAGTWCEEQGWKGGVVEDMGDAWGCVQNDPDSFASKDFAELDMGDGVVALVGATADGDDTGEEPAVEVEVEQSAKAMCDECMSKYVKEGLDGGKVQDQATAYAASMCKKECGEKGAVETPSEETPPAADTAKAAAASRAKATGDGPTTPVAPASGGSMGDSNAVLDAMRQTNVLLGTLIEAVRALGTKVEGMAPKPATGEQQAPPAADGGDATKGLDGLALNLKNLDERLKRIGA